MPRCRAPLYRYPGDELTRSWLHSSRIDPYHAGSPIPQEKEARYGRYNQLVDRDLSEGGVRGRKSGTKRQYDDEKMRLDLERVASERKKVQQVILLPYI